MLRSGKSLKARHQLCHSGKRPGLQITAPIDAIVRDALLRGCQLVALHELGSGDVAFLRKFGMPELQADAQVAARIAGDVMQHKHWRNR